MSRPPGHPPRSRSLRLSSLRPRQLLRALLGVGLVGLVGLAASWGLFQSQANARLSAALAHACRLDPLGWNLEALSARRLPIPDDANPAQVVEVVLELLPEGWPIPIPPQPLSSDDEDFPDDFSPQHSAEDLLLLLAELPPQTQVPPPVLQALDAELEASEPAVQHALELAETGPGRFLFSSNTNPLYSDLSHLQDVRVVLDLLRLKLFHATQHNDHLAAIQSVRAMLGLSRAIGDEPVSLSQIIRASCHGEAAHALSRSLAQGEPPLSLLEALQRDLQAASSAPLLRLAIDGDRAAVDQLFERLERGEISPVSFAAVQDGPAVHPLAMDLYLRAYFRWNRALLLQWNNRASALARLPFDQARPSWNDYLNDLERNSSPTLRLAGHLALLMRPAHRSILRIFTRDQARLRCAQLAIALERFRQITGAWPDSLPQLVPQYIDSLPLDPHRQTPLHYRRFNDGVCVYSVGPDGHDDGGTLDFRNDERPGTDQGIRLWNPAQRRQDPPVALRLPAPQPDPS